MSRFMFPVKSVLVAVVALFSVLIAIGSFRFVPFGVQETMAIVAHHLTGNSLFLYGHIVFAPIALALMPFQLMTSLRDARPRTHRWMGRAYVLCVLVSGLSGLDLAVKTTTGPLAAAGFGLLAVLWLLVTGVGVLFALRRQFTRHRVWMLRSAALTFSAVTLRLYLGLALAAGIDFSLAYPLIAWACWLPNAVVIEVYLRSGHSLRPHSLHPTG